MSFCFFFPKTGKATQKKEVLLKFVDKLQYKNAKLGRKKYYKILINSSGSGKKLINQNKRKKGKKKQILIHFVAFFKSFNI